MFVFTDLSKENIVVGTKQVLRGLASQAITKVIIANDADGFIKAKLENACKDHNVEIINGPTKQELGKACGISVAAACCGILKTN